MLLQLVQSSTDSPANITRLQIRKLFAGIPQLVSFDGSFCNSVTWQHLHHDNKMGLRFESHSTQQNVADTRGVAVVTPV